MRKKSALNQLTLASLLIGLNSLAVAANDTSVEKTKSKNSSYQQNMSPSLGDKLPPYNNPNRFSFDASFIYWRADVDGIDSALESSRTLDNSTGKVNESTSLTNKDLDFQWNPGFKVGIGAIFEDRDQWDLELTWTWLHSKAHRSQGNDSKIVPITGDVGTEVGLDSPFSVSLLEAPVAKSQTHWKLLYNTIDLDLGRNFFLGSNMTLRPFAGLRGAFLHQNTKVNYDVNNLETGKSSTLDFDLQGSSIFKGKNNYNGVGLHGGMDIHWNFTNSFCVFSTLSGSILFGNFSVKESFQELVNEEDLMTPSSSVFKTELANLSSKTHRTRTSLQAILGLMWHTDFNNDKQHLFVSAGYEVNQWFQQNELRKVSGSDLTSFETFRSPGDLGLHGLTVDLRFDF